MVLSLRDTSSFIPLPVNWRATRGPERLAEYSPTRVPQTRVITLSIRNRTDGGLALDFRTIRPAWPIPKLGGDDIISGDFRSSL